MKQWIILMCLLGVVGQAHAQQVQHLDLRTCLERGLQNNYSIRMVHNEEAISANNATWANAGMLPTLDLSAGYSGTLDNTSTENRETGLTVRQDGLLDQTVDAGLNLNWTLFDGLNMQVTYKQLQELKRQGELNTRIAVEDFVASLAAEYFNFVQQTIRLSNLRYAVQLSRERLRIVEARYHIGSFSRLDYQQAKVDFNEDSASYMKQQELLHTSRIRLNELMANREIDQPISIADSVIPVNASLQYGTLWEATLQANASLLKAGQNTVLAQYDYRKVLSRNYPYVKLNAGYGYTHNRYESGVTARRDNWGFKGGVTVGLNLFDGNRRRERRNAAIAVQNSRLEQQQLELNLQAEMSNLWQAYRNNLQLLNLERQNLVAAKENHEIARERYMLGDLSGIEMREAQKSLLDAEERILSAEYDLKLCEISLLQLSGTILDYLK